MKLQKKQLRNLILKEMKSVMNELDSGMLDANADGFMEENFDMFVKMNKAVFDEAERISRDQGFVAAAMYMAFELPAETVTSMYDVFTRGDLLKKLGGAYDKNGFSGLAVEWYKVFYLEYDFKQK